MNAATRWAGVAAGISMAILAGWALWHEWRPDAPVIAGYSEQEPVAIPVQAAFEDSQPAAGEESVAREQWIQALDAFRSAGGATEAARRSNDVLTQIARRWPESSYAVRAQLFAINTLGAYYPEVATKEAYGPVFVQRALQFPSAYFSGTFQASSQRVIAGEIERLMHAGDAAASWQLCLRFRWVASRLDLLAPVCGRVASKHPEARLAPGQLLALLPPQAARVVLPPEKLTPAIRDTALAYLVNPYDADALAALVRKLYKAGISRPTDALRLELPELDSGKASWELENAIDGITAKMQNTP